MKFLIPLAATIPLLLVACTGQAPRGEVSVVTPREAFGLLSNSFAVLVDVREQDEVKEGMAAPARWMATSRIESDDPEWRKMVETLPRDKQIVFYCAKGGRAKSAAARLARLGFRTAYFPGYDDWKGAGLPIRKP